MARAFLERYSGESRKKIKGFIDDAINAIGQYSWPGNVRELENRIKRAVIMAEGVKITLADMEMDEPKTGDDGMSLKDARENLEKDMLLKALSRNSGNLTKAATELGISRPTLYDLMDKLGIPRE
jgi:two-component system NtrC family response regulator